MEDEGDPGDLTYRCGRCGYQYPARTEAEWRKLYAEHTGRACLAILGRLTPDQIRYLGNDLLRIAGHGNTVKQLLGFLEDLAREREQGDSPAKGLAGESGE